MYFDNQTKQRREVEINYFYLTCLQSRHKSLLANSDSLLFCIGWLVRLLVGFVFDPSTGWALQTLCKVISQPSCLAHGG